MKKLIILISSMVVFFSLGGVVYADDTSTVSTSISDNSSINTNSITTTSKSLVLGSSIFDIVVNQDDCFIGLDTLVSAYCYNLDDNTKNLLLKELTTLVIDITTNGGYTLETFKTAFLEILVKYGIEITEDVLDAVLKYSIHYFNDDFEQEDNEQLLVWIGGTLGMMTTLFLTSQQGGVHRGY